MAKERASGAPPESVISIIGPGMHVVGDCSTDGTLRIEGSVKGSVRAGKAVVVGKEGFVEGEVFTQDAVISGRISGTLVAESRLELQATCRIDGEVRARRRFSVAGRAACLACLISAFEGEEEHSAHENRLIRNQIRHPRTRN